MAVRPDIEPLARFMIWGGALMIAGAYAVDALVDLKAEWLWLLNGLFFIFVGLSLLPRHPLHYLDFDDPAEVEAQRKGWAAQDAEE